MIDDEDLDRACANATARMETIKLKSSLVTWLREFADLLPSVAPEDIRAKRILEAASRLEGQNELIRRIRDERDALRNDHPRATHPLIDRLAAAEVDAERYRKLRARCQLSITSLDNPTLTIKVGVEPNTIPSQVDAAIDNALKGK